MNEWIMCPTKAFYVVWLGNLYIEDLYYVLTFTFIVNKKWPILHKTSVDALMKEFKSCKCRQEDWDGKTEGGRCLWAIGGALGCVVVSCACSWTCGVCGSCREGTHNRWQEWGKAGGFSEDLDVLSANRAGGVAGACVRAAAVWNVSLYADTLYGQNSSVDPWLTQLTHQRTTLITLREKESGVKKIVLTEKN